MGFQLGDIGRSNACIQSVYVAKRGIVSMCTMSFDVVNVNDEVLRDGEQRIDREGKH